ncbi:MAG TPA: exodeoxyribonuclease VII small subunit [Salinisphaeraceae bacterium]|nr:exodeoxyribonuclease VII small subunit [Salinisphaeraceae bacterium]
MTAKSDATDATADEASPQLAQFETALHELEQLVETLESGDVGLEQALAKFERGVALTRQCRELLQNAELRVDQLLAASETPAAMPPEDAPAMDNKG